jgi:hypothetical protein
MERIIIVSSAADKTFSLLHGVSTIALATDDYRKAMGESRETYLVKNIIFKAVNFGYYDSEDIFAWKVSVR